jgi:hypothetical protein
MVTKIKNWEDKRTEFTHPLARWPDIGATNFERLEMEVGTLDY